MKVKPNDILVLSGKTKHGKNRVREQGKLWRVVRIAPALPHGPHPPGTEVAELETLDGKHWRFITTKNDEDFDFDFAP